MYDVAIVGAGPVGLFLASELGLAGFDFVGIGPHFTGYLALVTVDYPEKLEVGFTLTPTGMYIRRPENERFIGVMDFDGGALDRSHLSRLGLTTGKEREGPGRRPLVLLILKSPPRSRGPWRERVRGVSGVGAMLIA